MSSLRLIYGLGLALLVIGLAGAALFVGYPYYKKPPPLEPEISYAEYAEIGNARFDDQTFRMAPMIELQCEISQDFRITRKEKQRYEQMRARLKTSPEKVYEHFYTICEEWEKL